MYTNVKLWKDEEGYWVVTIPKEYEFDSTELFVNELGGCITIAPEDKIQEDFDLGAQTLDKDFMIDEIPDDDYSDGGEQEA